jgi:hypothetical protein
MRITRLLAAAALGALGSAGCGSDDSGTADNSGTGGSGNHGGGINVGGGAGIAAGGTAGSAGAATCGSNVIGVARDFRASHPDFECTKTSPYVWNDPSNKDCGPWDPAIVGALGSAIGANAKPVYVGTTPSTTGAANFDQWFNDVPGVNDRMELTLTLAPSGQGTFVYDTDRFFPLDAKLFDAEPNNPDTGMFIDDDQKARNFHFTYELHTTFRYQAGDVFTFRGDDDVFVYIDGKLAVNIGGIHVPMRTARPRHGRVEITSPWAFRRSVRSPRSALPSRSPAGARTVQLGLVAEQIYAMDFFFAERNCCASNFRLETSRVHQVRCRR